MSQTLSPTEARAYYERNAHRQDQQGWYEDAALERLVAMAEFKDAETVLEVGCGSGRFAEALVARHLRPCADYIGLDIAWAMLDLTRDKLSAPAGQGGLLVQADATQALPLIDASVDRVIVAYVFDLLSEDDAAAVLQEAERVLRPGGLLCLASMTNRPRGPVSRLVAGLWASVQRLAPLRVGGCRPVALAELARSQGWTIKASDTVSSYGVPSEIVVAERNA